MLVGIDSGNEAICWMQENSALKFATNNTERMRINAGGDVGIGINPGSKLDVNGQGLFRGLANRNTATAGTGFTYFDMGIDSDGAVRTAMVSSFSGTSSTLEFTTSVSGTRAERMRIDSSGNVGIGTTSISQRLTVNGNISAAAGIFSGQLSVPQSSSVGTNGINLNAAGNGYLRGTPNDTASSTQANVQLMSWFGIGFSPSIGGQAVPQGENAVWIDVRTGTLQARSTITAGGRVLGLTTFADVAASGTAVNFSTIPTWVKRITLVMNGVSTNSTSPIIIRLGDAGGIESAGYTSYGVRTGTTGISGGTDLTGFGLRTDNAAINLAGTVTISHVTGNTWAAAWVLGSQGGGEGHFGGGGKTLDTALTTISVTTVIGTQTFDAGTITVIIE
jgi:hypothetical protein